MNAAVLMAKLLEIERSAGKVDSLRIRGMALEAQTCLLEIQRRCADCVGEMDTGELLDGAGSRSYLIHALPNWREVSSRLKPETDLSARNIDNETA